MAVDIVVPELGESISEGTIAAWLKQPGDAVGVDEPLVELETDKATIEIFATKGGVLSEILAAAGSDVRVGAVIGRIDDSGARAPRRAAATTPSAGAAVEARPALSAAPNAAVKAAPTGAAGRAAEPAAREIAESAAAIDLDPTSIARSGPGGAITLEDLLAFAARAAPAAPHTEPDAERSGPAARKLIADHGVDASRIEATGRAGRITKQDVLRAVAEPRIEAPRVDEPRVDESRVRDPRDERVRMSRRRRTIAARLKQAQNTAAILTTFNEVDMGAVLALRSRLRDEFEQRHGVKLGLTCFFVKSCVAALQEFPALNAAVDGDDIVYHHYYDIGVAVSTPDGLVVPVIRDCDAKTPAAIERSLDELARKARDGSLANEEMQGGSFSITNGGVFGSLLSTPILNPPQSGILGLHKIEDRPIAREGALMIRPMMYLALSYDHRIVDGREAVSFLVSVKQRLEQPEQLSMNLELS